MAAWVSQATRERAVALLVGTVLTVGVAEVTLRGLGYAMSLRQKAVGGAEITLLCEGDSFTYGIGGASYPEQLETMLNDKHGEGTVRTVNAGVPGLNSALLADELEAHLREYRPDAVLVIVGENNNWNSIRLGDGGAPSWWTRVDAALLHSRVYKFLRVAAVGWRHGTFHEASGNDHGFVGGDVELQRAANHLTDTREVIGYPTAADSVPTPPPGVADAWVAANRAKEEGRYDVAIAEFDKVTAGAPGFGAGWYGLATAYMRRKQNAPAIAALETALKLPPVDGEVYFTLGHAYAQELRDEEAVNTWRAGLVQWPASHKLYGALTRHLQERRQIWRTLEVVEGIAGIEENPLHRYLLTLQPHAVDVPEAGEEDPVRHLVMEGLRNDLRRTVRLARDYGAQVILGSYPDAAYEVAAEVAAEEGVSYIDFRPIYDARFESREAYLSADRCHCNTDGYRVMAEVFGDEVERVLGL
jgi:lysophospholipase L1-like esterase